MDRDGSSSPRHSDKSQSHTAAAAACASSASAQAAAAASAQAAFNYSAFLNASVSGGDSVMLGSTENLLRNIQGLLKVAAENARQQDRQANYEKGIQVRLWIIPFFLASETLVTRFTNNNSLFRM